MNPDALSSTDKLLLEQFFLTRKNLILGHIAFLLQHKGLKSLAKFLFGESLPELLLAKLEQKNLETKIGPLTPMDHLVLDLGRTHAQITLDFLYQTRRKNEAQEILLKIKNYGGVDAFRQSLRKLDK